MKGQVFLAGAFMLAVMLTLFSISLATERLEMPHEKEQMENIEQELVYAAGIAQARPGAVQNFAGHLRSKIQGFESLHVLVLPKDSAENGFYVRVGNNLHRSIEVEVKATNALPASASSTAADGSEAVLDFTSSGGSDIRVNYTFAGVSAEENLHFEPAWNATLLYDFTIKQIDTSLRRKGIYEIR